MVLILMLGISSYALAQRTISGTVTDAANGEALISATVVIKGTAIGTTTDLDGKYSIEVPEGSTTLVFTYIGYAAKEVELAVENTVDVQLSEGLDITEVVVVGYGTQQKGEITSSVVSISSKDFNQGNVHDPTQLVQGKVAGLSIAKVGSDPNASSEIRLRGLSTLGANTSPLIVIDGLIGGTLDNVDPNDIASIDILKDGSAAAIYGTRASSGVIIVTTKKGKSGKTTINYNVYATTEAIANQVSTASTDEFLQYRPASSNKGSSTDWVDLVTRDAFTHVHNISLSGGVGSTTYRASLNYRDVEGIGINSAFQQLNGRLNLSQKALDDKLTLDLNVSATEKVADFGLVETFRYATLYNPTAPAYFSPSDPLYEKYGGYYQSENFDFFNPLAIAEQNTNVGELKNLMISGRATLEIIDGLTVSAFVASQRESDLTGQYSKSTSYFRGFNRNGLATRFTEDRTNDLFETTVNYNKTFNGNLKVNVLAGYSWQENEFQNLKVEAGNFISDDLGFNNIEAAQDFANGLATVESQKENFKVIGFFGRLNLAYDNTYFLSAAVRREGSSRFGENNKWGTFPSVSGGVNIANLIESEGVDNLKLRIGYGETGALPPFSYLSLPRFSQNGSFFYNGGFVPAYAPEFNANPDLKWEIKEELNVGLDFAFLDYKLTGSIEYYDRTTRDLLFDLPVPVPPNQAPRTWVNLEDVNLKNSGVEVSVTYNYSKGDFSWSPTLTFGTYNTKINTVNVANPTYAFFGTDGNFFDAETSPGAPGLNDNPTQVVQANQPIGQHYGFIYEGVNLDDSTWVFRDINGDNTIDENDKTVIGNGLPDFSLGLLNSFSYKNLDFTFFFRGDFGHELSNMYRVFYEPLGGSRLVENLVITEHFLPNAIVTPEFSSYYIEDASFVVLDNITIGYTVPQTNGTFSKVRVYLTGRNLFYITDYSGVSPEVRYSDPGPSDNGGEINLTPNPLFPGIDRRNTYFTTRSFTIGVNLTF